ncbi:alpha/beta fold hydrolase [Pelagerythrobacter aerophilus]
MRAICGAGIALLGLAACTAIAETPPSAETTEVLAKTNRADTFPALEARYPGGIVARPHVEFANYVGYRPLQLDLYLHADRERAAPRPLVLWVHGGGWQRGDARQSGAFADWPAVLASLAARGFVVASIDYRLTGEARFPAQVQDVKAAIRYLRSQSAGFGIDPARVYLWGGSAGGHLAALAAASCGVAAFDPPASTGRLPGSRAKTARPLPQSDCAQGAVIWYGAFDLADSGEPQGSALGPAMRERVLGCQPDRCTAEAVAASPITYVSKETPPMLLIHGTADTTIPIRQSEEMAARMRAEGASVDLVALPEAEHGFLGKTPDATRRHSRDALARSFAFFDRLVQQKR